MKFLSSLFFIFLSIFSIAQQAGTLDLAYDSRRHNSYVDVQKAVVQSDQKIIVAGNVGKDFGSGSTAGICRLNTDASIDSSFKCSFPYPVDKLLLNSQGQLLVLARRSLYRFLSDGSRDPEFIFESEYQVKDAAILADNRIMILESRTSGDAVYRVKSYGLSDPTFQEVMRGRISAMGVITGGVALSVLDTSDKKYELIKVDNQGVLDTRFNSITYVDLTRIEGLPNGGLYVLQKQQSYWGYSLMRLDAAGKFVSPIDMDAREFCIDDKQFVYVNNGSLFFKVDSLGEISDDFQPSECQPWSQLALDGSGRVYVTGDLLRIKAVGGRDSSFVINKLTSMFASGIDGQDRLYVSENDAGSSIIRRYRKDGTLDQSFPEIKSSGIGLVENDGSVVVFSGISQDFYRYNAIGVKDTSFHSTYSVKHQLASGKYIAESYSWDYNTIVRLNSNGTLDPSFTSVTFKDYALGFIHELSDGKLILGMRGFPQGNQILRLNKDGGKDFSFQSHFTSILVGDLQKDEKMVFFTSENQALKIRRLLPDGTFDPSFAETAISSDYLNAQLVVDKNDNIIATENGRVYRLKPNGEPDPTFAEGTVPLAFTKMMVQHDNQILCIGRWSFYNETPGEGRFRINNGPDYTGIDEKNDQQSRALVYPNPTSDKLYIDNIKSGPVKMEVFNVNGQLLREIDATKAEEPLKVEVSGLHPGSYILRVVGQNEVQSLHFSKF